MLNIHPRPLMTRARVAATAALSTAVTFLLLAPALASAAPDASSGPGGTTTKASPGGLLGQRVADLITDFTKPLLVAVAGMMSFAAFGKRDTGRVLTILMVTLVIGGLVYNPGNVIGTVIETMWTQVS